jgi:hypothetical protein
MTDAHGDSPAVLGMQLTDRISLGVLTRLVTRELVSEVLADTRKSEIRSRLLPARVVVYFVLALTLFYGDSYEEVMRKLVQGLRYIGIWKREWKVPTSSALSQARQRLGVEPLREIYERVAVPCAMKSTAGAWKSGRRLMSVDGVELDVPDSAENAAQFGYKGVKQKEKAAYPKVPCVALAECGTHAVVAIEVGGCDDGEHTLARRLVRQPGALKEGMLVMFDRGLYSHELLTAVVETGADACFRMSATLDLPALRWFSDGSYLSYIAEPEAKKRARAKLKSGKMALIDLPGIYVRVVDYEVPGRGEKNELFTLMTSIIDPAEMYGVELAEAYHERWEIEITFDEIETHQRGPGALLRSKSPDLVIQELYGLLITHYGIRQLMVEAADQADLDPTPGTLGVAGRLTGDRLSGSFRSCWVFPRWREPLWGVSVARMSLRVGAVPRAEGAAFTSLPSS